MRPAETVEQWGERCGYGTRELAAVAPATTVSQHVPADHAPRPWSCLGVLPPSPTHTVDAEMRTSESTRSYLSGKYACVSKRDALQVIL